MAKGEGTFRITRGREQKKNDALARIVFSFNNLSFSPHRGCVFQGNFGNNALLRFRAVEEG